MKNITISETDLVYLLSIAKDYIRVYEGTIKSDENDQTPEIIESKVNELVTRFNLEVIDSCEKFEKTANS